MDMKKNILLSMILLALCLIQASADTYYYKIKLYNDNQGLEAWSKYIKVSHSQQQGDWVNGLRDLIAGNTVTDEENNTYTLPTTTDGKVDLDRIWGIVFANGKGRGKGTQEKILEGDEFTAWKEIRTHIKYLELREYKCDTYNNSGYFMNMHKVEALELPKDGMTVGDGDKDGELYFANADNLKQIFIWDGKNDHVDITNNAVKDKKLLNIVGKYMFLKSATALIR